MPPRLLDGLELARSLGEHYTDVMAWARDGLIPRVKVGGKVYFNLNAVVRSLRQREESEAEAIAS